MKRVLAAWLVLMIVVISGTVMVQPSIAQNQPDERDGVYFGEGRIEVITETTIGVNDTVMAFPSTVEIRAENGDTLSRSSLHVGDKIFYSANYKRVLVYVGKFTKQ